MKGTTHGWNASGGVKVTSAFISCLWVWCSRVLFPLQHMGLSLTTSVRPWAEKDLENTKGQVGLDTGHRLPEAGAPWGWNALLGCFLHHQLLHSPFSHTGFQRPGSLLVPKSSTVLLCSCRGLTVGERHRVADSVGKHHTKPWTFILYLLPQLLGIIMHRRRHQAVLEQERHLGFHRWAQWPWEGKGLA